MVISNMVSSSKYMWMSSLEFEYCYRSNVSHFGLLTLERVKKLLYRNIYTHHLAILKMFLTMRKFSEW